MPVWTGLPEGAAAWRIAQQVSRASGPTWVIAPDSAEAERLAAELSWHGAKVAYFPPNDGRPYEGLSPHPELPKERILALHGLLTGVQVVVAPAKALLLGVLPPGVLAGAGVLKVGSVVEPRALATKLEELGFLPVGRVDDPGSFHHRGGEVMDLWPPTSDCPLRVEWFDDEIERISTLDLETLRSTGTLDSLTLLPAREEVLGELAMSRARRLLRERCERLGYGERLRREVLEDAKAGLRFSGMDAWLPAFHELVSPLSYVPDASMVVLDLQGCVQAVEEAEALAISAHGAMPVSDRPLVGPLERHRPASEVTSALNAAQRIEHVGFDGAQDQGFVANSDLRVVAAELAPLVGRLSGWLDQGWRVALVADSASRADQIRQLFGPHGLVPTQLSERSPQDWPQGSLVLLRGDLPRGFRSELQQIALVTADEIFGEKHRVRHGAARRRKLGRDSAQIESFGQLSHGDLVVHERHGIGRYLGLETLDLGQGPQDMVQLEYRGGARMYLPVFRLDQLYSYRQSGKGVVKLDKLGGESWSLRKSKVKAEVLKLAHELLQLQARRQVHPGHAYAGRSQRFRAFESAFPYTETPDQANAIQEVLEDLALPHPMDRLVVGDAGFGKTEVAMRAAFRVVEEGRQVALLCPTTVLAYQHHRTLTERMGPHGVRVGLLSRFGDAAHTRALNAALKAGELDVVVGTTRILGRGVRFADLGLVVVDEEHRFGVKQKERLKRLRAEVDYLAMSATPIPRTLHMAMSGIRGFSIISTPPLDRLPVRTYVARFGPERIREDLMRELRRGGQSFFVHNRIESIQSVGRAIAQAVPEARIAIAHGQLSAAELEQVLVDFVERRTDLLLCTAIIESGIDMPNVNTIVVNQADRFGLAQLYQLRGRVGRSHKRGYCTLMVDEGKRLTADAQKRLRVLQEHTRLGSGFAVASADLELRGAGNLLGDRQHGQIAAVGFETYMQLLDQAMSEAAGVVERQRIEVEVEVPRPAFIPEEYLPGVEERLMLYKRLSSARSVGEVQQVIDQVERDQGELPQPLLNLGRQLELQARCREMGITKAVMLQVRAVFVLHEQHQLQPERLKELARSMPKRVRMKSADVVEIAVTPEEGMQPYLFLHWALDLLGG